MGKDGMGETDGRREGVKRMYGEDGRDRRDGGKRKQGKNERELVGKHGKGGRRWERRGGKRGRGERGGMEGEESKWRMGGVRQARM